MDTKEYLINYRSANPDTWHLLAAATLDRYLGITKPDGGGNCTNQNCHDTTGCNPGSVNGACECVGGICTWIPDIG